MADPINQGLEDELNAALKVLAPQIRGLPDIARTSVSGDMIAALNQQLAVRMRRRDLIQAVLDQLHSTFDALDALEADGWPTPVGPATLDHNLFVELQGEQSDIEAAVEVFKQDQASALTLTLGEPVPKPT